MLGFPPQVEPAAQEGEVLPEDGVVGGGDAEADAELIAQLQNEVENLKYELEDARKLAQNASLGGDEAQRLANENSTLQQQLAATETEKAELFAQVSALQTAQQELADEKELLEMELSHAKEAASQGGESSKVCGGRGSCSIQRRDLTRFCLCYRRWRS